MIRGAGLSGRTVAVRLAMALCGLLLGSQAVTALAAEESAAKSEDYAGSAVCGGCHEKEAKGWKASQHARAMQEATEATVLGDFNGAQTSHFSSRHTSPRKDGRFFVTTEGKDGKEAEFAVKYTFGVDPLQQYLVEFPDGRLQALPYAWDTRPKAEGGQRWFHLYFQEDIPPSDALHWTRPQQNWNYMCAECRSTNVHKNYDAAKDSFESTFSQVSIGCEACHGAGAGHVRWAQNGRSGDVAHSGFASAAVSRCADLLEPGFEDGPSLGSGDCRRWQRERDLRPLPFEARRVCGDMAAGPSLGQHAPAGFSDKRTIRRRWADEGRGVQHVFVPAEKMYAKGVLLRRLPRSAQRQAQGGEERSLFAVP